MYLKIIFLKFKATLGYQNPKVYCEHCNDAYVMLSKKWVCEACHNQEHLGETKL